MLAYHFSAEELETLTTSQSLRRALHVFEEDVCLPSHFLAFHCRHVYHGSVRGEENVELAAQIILLYLLGQVLNVDGLVGRYSLLIETRGIRAWSGSESHCQRGYSAKLLQDREGRVDIKKFN